MTYFSTSSKIGAIMLTMVLFFSGCGDTNDDSGKLADSNSSATPKASDSGADSAGPEQTSSPSASPTRKNSSQKSPNSKDEIPEDSFVTKSTLPKGFPKELPLPTQGKLKAATATPDGWTLEYSGINATDYGKLQRRITEAGGVLSFESPSNELKHAMYEMPNYSVQLLWIAGASNSDASLGYVVTKNS